MLNTKGITLNSGTAFFRRTSSDSALLLTLEVTACDQVWLSALNKPILKAKLKVESRKRKFTQRGHPRKRDKEILQTHLRLQGPGVRSEFRQRAKDMHI